MHQILFSRLITTINVFIRSNKCPCQVYPAPFDVRVFRDDSVIVQPDICVICDTSGLTDKGMYGAHDWIIEIASPSSLERDYFTKLYLYKEVGLREYWIVNPDSRKTSVYVFTAGT